MKNIEKAIHTLLSTEQFYAHFFLASRVIYDAYGVGTAAAAMSVTGPILIFNTEFMKDKTTEETVGVVKHEILHLLFEHVQHMQTKLYDQKLANISMDLAINEFIPNLPKCALKVENFNKQFGLTLERQQTWEYYYAQLSEQSKKNAKLKEALEAMGTLDDHQASCNIPGQTVKPDEARQALRSAMDAAIKAGKGEAPSEIMKILESLMNSSKLPWKQILANFIARSTSSVSTFTRKKAHRRFDVDFPGKKKKRELTLGVCVDSSGSVSDDSYDQFMAEIMRLAPLCSKVYFIEADAVVQRVETITKTKKPSLVRKGYGGTAYQPAITKAVELGCDAILYFGDFDTSDTPVNPGKPFLWVGVGNSPKPGNFGSEVRI